MVHCIWLSSCGYANPTIHSSSAHSRTIVESIAIYLLCERLHGILLIIASYHIIIPVLLGASTLLYRSWDNNNRADTIILISSSDCRLNRRNPSSENLLLSIAGVVCPTNCNPVEEVPCADSNGDSIETRQLLRNSRPHFLWRWQWHKSNSLSSCHLIMVNPSGLWSIERIRSLARKYASPRSHKESREIEFSN